MLVAIATLKYTVTYRHYTQNTMRIVVHVVEYCYSMYSYGFSCNPVASISVISVFWVQICPAVRTQWITPLTSFFGTDGHLSDSVMR